MATRRDAGDTIRRRSIRPAPKAGNQSNFFRLDHPGRQDA